MARPIGTHDDTFEESDRGGDQNDRARDRNDRGGDQTQNRPFRPKPGHEYAWNYPDPLTGEPLQIYPSKSPSDFDSMDDFWVFMDAVTRRNNGLPPPRPLGGIDNAGGSVPTSRPPKRASRFKPTKSWHLGLRLTETDHGMLCELARAHGVRPGTMARMLVVRAVRAAADESRE